jgi:hypothetical protein
MSFKFMYSLLTQTIHLQFYDYPNIGALISRKWHFDYLLIEAFVLLLQRTWHGYHRFVITLKFVAVKKNHESKKEMVMVTT